MEEHRGLFRVGEGRCLAEQVAQLAAAGYHGLFEVVDLCGGLCLDGRIKPYALLGNRRVAEELRECHYRGSVLVLHHVGDGVGFYVYGLVVVFKQYLRSCVDLALGKYPVPCEYVDALLVLEMGDSVNAGNEVRKSAPFRFPEPRFVVGVAVEDDALVISECACEKVMQSFLESVAAERFAVRGGGKFQLVRELAQLLGYDSVEYDVRGRNVL